MHTHDFIHTISINKDFHYIIDYSLILFFILLLLP